MNTLKNIYEESRSNTETVELLNLMKDLESIRKKLIPTSDAGILLAIFRDITQGLARGRDITRHIKEISSEFVK